MPTSRRFSISSGRSPGTNRCGPSRREQIQRAEALYARLNAGKSGVPRSDIWLPVLMKWLPFILVGQIGFLLGAFFDHAAGFMAAALLSIPLGLAGLHWQQRGLRRLMQLAQQSTSDPLIARMYTDSRGVEAQLEMAMLSQQAHLKTCLTRLQDTAVRCRVRPKEADTLAQNCANGLVQQHQETEQVATAINEMAATTQEVASNVALAADATRKPAASLSTAGKSPPRRARPSSNSPTRWPRPAKRSISWPATARRSVAWST